MINDIDDVVLVKHECQVHGLLIELHLDNMHVFSGRFQPEKDNFTGSLSYIYFGKLILYLIL